MVQECWAVTVIEVPGSADVELDLGVFPVIPVQLAIFSTPSARVSQTFRFGNHIQNTKFYTEGWSYFAMEMYS